MLNGCTTCFNATFTSTATPDSETNSAHTDSTGRSVTDSHVEEGMLGDTSGGAQETIFKPLKKYSIIVIKILAQFVGSIVLVPLGAIAGVIRFTFEFSVNRYKHFKKHHNNHVTEQRMRIHQQVINSYEGFRDILQVHISLLDNLSEENRKGIEEIIDLYKSKLPADTDEPTSLRLAQLDKETSAIFQIIDKLRKHRDNKKTPKLTETDVDRCNELYKQLERKGDNLLSRLDNKLISHCYSLAVTYRRNRDENPILRTLTKLREEEDTCTEKIALYNSIGYRRRCWGCCLPCNSPPFEWLPALPRAVGFTLLLLPYLTVSGFINGAINTGIMLNNKIWNISQPTNKFPWFSRYPFGDGEKGMDIFPS